MNENLIINEEKISVSEYLDNNDLLEVSYIPYEQKVDICDAILSQIIVNAGYQVIDSALLERVSTQVFIENITNIDMDIVDDDGLQGYDTLCYYNELYNLIEDLNGFDDLNHILELKVRDFYNNQGSLRGFLYTLKETVISKCEEYKKDVNEFIDSLDSKQIANKLSSFINQTITNRK